MAAPQVFKVVTQFVFEDQVTSGLDGLERKLDGVSAKAQSAIDTVVNLGSSFALQFSGASGGVLGLLSKAITASDDFTNSQLSFTNIIGANMHNLTGTIETFNDKMQVSRSIMGDIQKDAEKFSVPAKGLLEITKSLSALLVPKGLAGNNFENARTLGRNLLKSAPNLNVDPNQVQGQLIRSIEGGASTGDTLFRRLLTEAPEPFEAAGVKDAKSFNALKAAERFNILNDAMAKFSSNTDVLTARTRTLSGLWQRITDLTSGFSSVLKPLGDVIIPPLVEIIETGINILKTQGAQIIQSMARFIKPLIENPKQLMIGLMQVADLAKDVGSAASITGLLVFLAHLQHFASFVAKTQLGGQFLTSISMLGVKFPLLGKAMSFVSSMGSRLATFLGGSFFAVIGKMLGLFGLLTVVFQAASRALAKAKLERISAAIEQSARFTDAIVRIKESFMRFMAPINDIIEGLSEFFLLFIPGRESVDGLTDSIVGMADAMDTVSTFFIQIWAGIRMQAAGLLAFIAEAGRIVEVFFGNLLSGNFTGLLDNIDFTNSFDNIVDAMMEEFNSTVDRNLFAIDNNADNSAVVQNNTNIGKIEINQEFKERQNPDRIAFSVKEQILKTANNPTQGRRSLSGGLRKGTGVASL